MLVQPSPVEGCYNYEEEIREINNLYTEMKLLKHWTTNNVNVLLVCKSSNEKTDIGDVWLLGFTGPFKYFFIKS